MRKIPLHGKYGAGNFALIDDEDYSIVILFRWRVDANLGYVITQISKSKSNVLKQLGRYDNEIEAARIYNDAAKIMHREYACLNIV